VIVAVPFPFEATSPADEIVATVVSEDTKVTVGLTIVLSFTSLTVSVSVAVSANDAKLRVVGDSVTELTT
jgi:hypothetical protein